MVRVVCFVIGASAAFALRGRPAAGPLPVCSCCEVRRLVLVGRRLRACPKCDGGLVDLAS